MDPTAHSEAPDLDLLTIFSPSGTALGPSIHCYLPIAAGYFFLNSAGLPLGLFYTTLFAPFLYLWLYLRGRRWLTTMFLLVALPFVIAHTVLGIGSLLFYVRSLFLLWTVFVAAYAFCWALMRTNTVERLFDQLIFLNFFASVVAVLLLATPLRDFLWVNGEGSTEGASYFLRLKLLSTEPSAYALLMLPLLVFATLRQLRDANLRNLIYLFMIGIPFLLCQSFGGISMFLAGIGIALMVSQKRMFKQAKTLIVLTCLVVIVGVLLGTHNPISERVVQVVTGGDSSTRSRTIFSFIAAYAVAAPKSLWWGAGFGQTKLTDFSDLGIGFVVNVIPNAVAATFAEVGIIGVLVKLAVEIYLFFKTRVYSNSFAAVMFTVGFIAQFTGSYLTDVQEYLIWCFAFYPFFPNLNLRAKPRHERFPASQNA